MPRGGKRGGAGRPVGPQSLRTEKTREIAEKAFSEGMTPLEVMLKAMREAVDANNMKEAATFAKDAAPYVHPRLAAVEHAGPNGGPVQHSVEVIFVDSADDLSENED
jgi:hypothetical protein